MGPYGERDALPPGGQPPHATGWDTPNPWQPGPPAEPQPWPPPPISQSPYPPARFPNAGPYGQYYPPPTFGPSWPTPPPTRRSLKWVWIAAPVFVVVAMVVGLAVWLAAPRVAPAGVALTELDDGVRIGYPTTAVTIDIFDEPICPPCSQFVTSSSIDLRRAVNAGKIALRYHLLNFLDDRSASGDYSTRAIAATLCIAETKNATTYSDFYVDMFASNFQPAEQASTDRSDDELAHLAQAVGTPATVTDCIISNRLAETARTKAANAQTTLQNLNSRIDTPNVFNGTTKVDESKPGWVDGLFKSS